jgi:thioesterase domain-containing protein
VLVTSGPQQYARLAAAISGTGPVWALDWPGFEPGGPLPADVGAAVTAAAELVGRCVDHAADEPFALVGYSSGGVLAQAVAHHLEMAGTPPCGVVLLDSRPLRAGWLESAAGAMFDALAGRTQASAPPDDARIIAMAHYLRLLTGWEPPSPDAPILAVRAERPLGDDGEAGIEAAGPADMHIVDVPGDHFTIIENQAETTARAVGAWIAGLARG